MEFFGVTLYGPQNYIGDLIKEGYHEPQCKEEVEPLMKDIISNSTCPEKVGWLQCDPALANKTWYVTNPRYPAPASPNTLILNEVRKNNKYATLF